MHQRTLAVTIQTMVSGSASALIERNETGLVTVQFESRQGAKARHQWETVEGEGKQLRARRPSHAHAPIFSSSPQVSGDERNAEDGSL